MVVRDAHPDDVAAIAEMTGTSQSAAAGLLQKRTVRVHVDEEGDDTPEGVVSFDASPQAVQLTHLAGAPAVYSELLQETIQFADDAGVPIETVVPDDERAIRQALTEEGFTSQGAGPRFEGDATTRYRWTLDGAGSDGPDGDHPDG